MKGQNFPAQLAAAVIALQPSSILHADWDFVNIFYKILQQLHCFTNVTNYYISRCKSAALLFLCYEVLAVTKKR